MVQKFSTRGSPDQVAIIVTYIRPDYCNRSLAAIWSRLDCAGTGRAPQ